MNRDMDKCGFNQEQVMGEAAYQNDGMAFVSETLMGNGPQDLDTLQELGPDESMSQKSKDLSRNKAKKAKEIPKVQNCPKETSHCKCCQKFPEQNLASRKMARAKIDRGDFQCDICPYKIAYSQHTKRIREHRATHDKNICDQCNYETYSKRDLSYHTLRNHKEKPMYYCEKCGYKSNKAGNVEKHNLSVHEGIRINCDQCKKKFSQHSDLNRHMSALHGVVVDPILKCNICMFTTKHRQFLTKHLKMHVVEQIV